ncbi:MAG: carboxyl-terminal protease [Gemmatimonadetes bacterium]|jgi:carboxyl-terminal processing protease|nr:carboxyl-terminal protease [Gemmatimonadota bacterium]
MRRRTTLAALVLLPVLAGGFLVQDRASTDGAKLLDQVFGLVSQRFVDTVSTASLYEKAARGMVKELNDPYSELLSPKELAQFSQQTNGRYAGIGMQIEDLNGNITISKVFPHSPAEAGGVREGDRILQVDTLSTRGWKTQQVSDYLIGVPGTRVNVKFGRAGVTEPISMTFTRKTIHIPAVAYSIVLENRIGYIPVQRFNETAADEVAAAVTGLQKQGVKGIILDLRGNPGGILDQSIDMSNLFLKNGQGILSVRGRAVEAQNYVSRGDPTFPDIPLTVMTDEGSASASEIVAGALQDHDRALVVGSTSYGKGLVQTLFPLDGGYALKITTAKWYTPSGRTIQRERKFVNGRFVEEPVDTAETEAKKRARPAYRSDAGRIVYGGGGITPDVLVRDDTLTTREQAFSKAIAPKSQEVYVTLADYALELSRGLNKDFTVQPQWRDEFFRRLQAKGVVVERPQYDAASRYVDRLIEQRVARVVAGDSTAKRRDLRFDAPLRRALELMEKGSTQKDLFTLATASAERKS